MTKPKTDIVPFAPPAETSVLPGPPPSLTDHPKALMLEQHHERPLFMAMVMGAMQGAVGFIEILKNPQAARRGTKRARRPADSAEFMDETALCETIGISPVTATKWRANASGPRFVKIGRLVRYRRTDVDEWIASRTKG